MKRSSPFRLLALLYVIAWLLPVDEHGTTLAGGGLPGWEAFLVALLPDDTNVFYNAISIVSALTNFLMLLCLFWLAAPATAPRVRKIRWVIVAAAAINAYWFRLGTDLLLGYYCWLGSFVALAVVAFRVKQVPGDSDRQAAG